MLIRTGMGGQLSGSVAGVTAARNRYGQYLRNRSVPVNTNTDRQQQNRESFAAATIAWRGLTPGQRQSWTAYANQTPTLNRLGEVVTLTGQAMYVRTNSWLGNAGLPPMPDAPPTPGIASLGELGEITLTESNITINQTGATATACVMQIGPSLSPGVSFFASPYTQCGVLDGYNATNAPVITLLSNRYGPLLSGQRRPVRLTGMDPQGRLASARSFIATVGSVTPPPPPPPPPVGEDLTTNFLPATLAEAFEEINAFAIATPSLQRNATGGIANGPVLAGNLALPGPEVNFSVNIGFAGAQLEIWTNDNVIANGTLLIDAVAIPWPTPTAGPIDTFSMYAFPLAAGEREIDIANLFQGPQTKIARVRVSNALPPS